MPPLELPEVEEPKSPSGRSTDGLLSPQAEKSDEHLYQKREISRCVSAQVTMFLE